LDPARVAQVAARAAGPTLAELDPDAVASRLREDTWIREARVMALPTGRLLVRIDERVPRATLRGSGPDAWLLVDATGDAFAPAAEGDLEALPRVLAGEIAPGDALERGLAEAVSLADSLPELGLAAPVEVRLPKPGDPLGWVLRLRGIPCDVVLGFGAPIEQRERLERLARLLASDLAAARTASRIDLRFADRAVLRRGSPASG
ncbi:MAG: cell division protein FtsQ/DivIB, partial [Proteobacteria bacterium]|nr:cell division protein FtsQ/DivIB [Pseudomonadota bacterium]